MVQHCFNPACRREFQLLHAGDLYALEWGTADTEFFWLCSDCACNFDLSVDQSGAVTLSTRGEHRKPSRLPRDAKLRLISRCARPAPRPDSRPTAERRYSFIHGSAEPHSSGYRPRFSSARWQHEDEPTILAVESAA